MILRDEAAPQEIVEKAVKRAFKRFGYACFERYASKSPSLYFQNYPLSK